MDTFYLRPQKVEPINYGLIIYYTFFGATMIYSVVSLFFLPIDIAAIRMSLDPGFTIFFILVTLVFTFKIICVVDFHATLFIKPLVPPYREISLILQGLGSIFVGLSFIIVAVEIYILTQSFLAVIVHPFVIDFGLFLFCKILAYAHIFVPEASSEENFMYLPVPQQQNNQPMYQMPQMKAPVVPAQEQIQMVAMPAMYPELPIQEPVRQVMQSVRRYPEMPIPVPMQMFQQQVRQPRMVQMVPKPEQPVMPEQPKVPENSKARPEFMAFVPYYMPK